MDGLACGEVQPVVARGGEGRGGPGGVASAAVLEVVAVGAVDGGPGDDDAAGAGGGAEVGRGREGAGRDVRWDGETVAAEGEGGDEGVGKGLGELVLAEGVGVQAVVGGV